MGKCCFQLFFQIIFGGNNSCAGVAHCIGNKTAVHGKDPGVFGVGHHTQLSLFAVDTWEIGIRCETTGELFGYLVIVSHTSGTGLFVAAHDQADSFVQFYTVVAEKLHGVERFQNRTFVIGSSTSVYMVAFTGKLKWIISPVTTHWHDIQMSGDSNDLIALTHFCIATVVVQVYGFKTKLIGNLETFFQGFCRAFTERLSFGRCAELGVDGNQSAKVCEHFF